MVNFAYMQEKLKLIDEALQKYGKLTRMPNSELADLYQAVFETPAKMNCGACIGSYVNQLRKFHSANLRNNQ